MEERLILEEYRIKNALVIQSRIDPYTGNIDKLVLGMYHEYLCVCGVDKTVLKEIYDLVDAVNNVKDIADCENKIRLMLNK